VCYLTWKVKATKSKRLYFQLAGSMPRIEETGCGLWPTPATRDHHAQGATHNPKGRSSSLATVVQKRPELWPTPQARDYFPPHKPEYIAAKKAQGHGMSNLNDAIEGSLNPAWVEWLMGYPPGWTDISPENPPSPASPPASPTEPPA